LTALRPVRFAAGGVVTALVVLVFLGAANRVASARADGPESIDRPEGADKNVEESAETLFREGNEAYAAKDFQTAIKKYSRIVDAGIRDGAVEFNLANACFRSGDLGHAILHYERAARLLPRNTDVRQNLRIARKQTEDLATEEDVNGVVRFFRKFAFSLTANEWSLLLSACFFAMGAVLVVRTFVRGEAARLRLRNAAVILAVAFVFSAGSVAAHWYRLSRPDAVILVPEVKLYAEPAPGPDDKHLFLLHEGTVVRVLRTEGDWVLVRFGPAMRGFCPKDVLEEI
jgi:tetratricopeptide (TPR) repeat protein